MKNIIERAVELASSGSYSSVSDICKQLTRENYAYAEAHLGGALTRRQLTARISSARAERNLGTTDTKLEGNDA